MPTPGLDRAQLQLEAQRVREGRLRELLGGLAGFNFAGGIFPRFSVFQALLMTPTDPDATPQASQFQPDLAHKITEIFDLASSLRRDNDEPGEVFWYALKDELINKTGLDLKAIEPADIRSFLQFFVDSAHRYRADLSSFHSGAQALSAFMAVARWIELDSSITVYWSYTFDNPTGAKRKRMDNDDYDKDQKVKEPSSTRVLQLPQTKRASFSSDDFEFKQKNDEPLKSFESKYEALRKKFIHHLESCTSEMGNHRNQLQHLDSILRSSMTALGADQDSEACEPETQDFVNLDQIMIVELETSDSDVPLAKTRDQRRNRGVDSTRTAQKLLTTGWEAIRDWCHSIRTVPKPEQGKIIQLLDLPAIPEQLKKRKQTTHFNLSTNRSQTLTNLKAAIAQAVGSVMHGDDACDDCKSGKGFWRTCVTSSAMVGLDADPLLGSCANCHYNVWKSRCSLRRPAISPESPARSSSLARGDDGDNGKMTAGSDALYQLSAPLVAICGERRMSRTDVMKKLWEYAEINQLLAGGDEELIICDTPMYRVFGLTQLDRSDMTKLISDHLSPVQN